MNEQKRLYSVEWDDCILEGLEPNDRNTVQEFLHAFNLLNINDELFQNVRINAAERTGRFLVISLKSNSDLQNVKDVLEGLGNLVNGKWNNSTSTDKKASCYEVVQTDTDIRIKLTT